MKQNRGRKRKYDPFIPAHIEQDKLPKKCYWHRAKEYWYTSYTDDTGRPRTKRIAGKFATLSDLHKKIDEFKSVETETYKWLSGLFQKSPDFMDLSSKTKQDYTYSSSLVENYQTSIGKPLGEIGLAQWDTPLLVKLIDKLGSNHGRSAANHALRYTSRLFRWGKNRGYIKENYATGVKQLKETPDQQYVEDPVYFKVLDYAKKCSKLKQQEAGSCQEYIWPIMEIAYLCRLRGIEVVTMKEDYNAANVLMCKRTKGSRANNVKMNDRLKKAWDTLIERRNKIWEAKKIPVPIDPKKRPLIVGKSGYELKKSALDTAWQRMIVAAIGAEVITDKERFSLHDLKRKGVTDTPGNRHDKQDASGHRSERMMDTYDKSVPLVEPSAN